MNKLIIIFAILSVVMAATGWYMGRADAPQQTVYQIGMVSYGGAHNEAIDGLRDGLSELGYEEGRNIFYHIIDAGGSIENVREAVTNFIAMDVDLIYSITTPITLAAAEIADRPVVFNIVSDPVGPGIADNWLSSGNHTTGCSNYVGQTGPKRLEIAKELFPDMESVLVLYDPVNEFSLNAIEILRDAAETLDVILEERHIDSSEEVLEVLAAIEPGLYDIFFHLGEARVSGVADEVVSLVNAAHLPSVAHEQSFAERGMLVTYGPSWYQLGVQCASVASKVLQGTAPAEIPIQIPEKLDLIVNLNTAETLGIEISSDFLFRADLVIE